MRPLTRAAPDAARGHRTAEVRVLVLMLSACSVGALAAALLPMTPGAPNTLNAALGVVGLVLAGLVWLTPWRGWRWLAPGAVLAGLTAEVALSATPQGTATSAVGLVWVVLYAALFASRRLSRLCVAAVAVALAAALRSNPFDGALHTWVLVVLTAAAASEALGRTVTRLQRMALTDPLTGLLNRDGLRAAAERALAQAVRDGEPLTVVVVDLDGFKAVNDGQGHAAGDALLVRLASAWSHELRPADLLARLGGDEFVLVLPRTAPATAREVVRRLRTVSATGWSYGLAPFRPDVDLDALLREADADLYRAKAARPSSPSTLPAG